MIYTNITANEFADLRTQGKHLLIDIREADEFAREAIPGARNMPLSELAACDCPEDISLVFYCRTGRRTEMAATQLAEWAGRSISVLEGGIEAWRKAGEPTILDRSQPLELNRQVQIAAGSLVLLGVLGSIFMHPGFIWLSAFVGAGLTFAGLSGTCGMARILMLMPWNRHTAA